MRAFSKELVKYKHTSAEILGVLLLIRTVYLQQFLVGLPQDLRRHVYLFFGRRPSHGQADGTATPLGGHAAPEGMKLYFTE